MLEELKKKVYQANLDLVKQGLAHDARIIEAQRS